MSDDDEKLLTKKDASEFLGISIRRLDEMLADGLKCVPMKSSRIKFRKQSLREFVRSKERSFET